MSSRKVCESESFENEMSLFIAVDTFDAFVYFNVMHIDLRVGFVKFLIHIHKEHNMGYGYLTILLDYLVSLKLER